MIMEEEEKLESELNRLIQSSVEYRKTQRDEEYINNQAHYEGVYWNLASYNTDTPFILRSDINHVKNAIDTRLSSIFSNDYSGSLVPKSPNDKKAIETLEIIYKYEWKRLKMDEMIKKILKDAVVLGEGYLQLSYDSEKIEGGTGTRNEGFIKVNYIHTTTVYIDPSATDIESSDYIVYKTRRTKEWIKRNKPQWLKILEDKNKDGTKYSNLQEDGELYSASRDYTTNQENIYSLNTICRKVPFTKTTEEGEEITGTKVNIYYVINGVIVEKQESYPFDFYDLEKLTCEEIPQTPYGVPLMRGLTTPQKVANLIESSINNVAMHYTVPTYLISDESSIDIDEFAKYQAALGVIFKVSGDPTKAVAQLPYPIIDAKLVEYGREFVQYIRMYSGVNDQYIGNIGSAGNTSSGTMAAISRATAIDTLLIGQIEKFVESFSKKLIKFMIRYYKDRHIWIRKQNGKLYTFKEYVLDEEIGNIDYDFDIDLSYKTKNDKDRQYNELKNIYQLQNQYKDSTPLIKSLDLVRAAQLDEYPELFKRNSDMSEEAWAEKIELAINIMPALSMTDANGVPIITPEEFQQGMIDIFNDDNELSIVEGIIAKIEEYQSQEGAIANESQSQVS